MGKRRWGEEGAVHLYAVVLDSARTALPCPTLPWTALSCSTLTTSNSLERMKPLQHIKLLGHLQMPGHCSVSASNTHACAKHLMSLLLLLRRSGWRERKRPCRQRHPGGCTAWG